MRIYYCESRMGCCIRAYENDEAAIAEFKAEVGWSNYESVKQAKAKDVAYVKSMGGYIPEEAKKLLKD